MSPTILITGANGQVGAELSAALADRYGSRNILTTDINPNSHHANIQHEVLDVTNMTQIQNIVTKYKVTQIYHLAATCSLEAEKNPSWAWRLNCLGLFNILETAAVCNVAQVFWPSSIAVFGPTTPHETTPQHTVTEPSTIYGISKQAGEGLCRWYFEKKGVDVRSIRYPGIISHKVAPGGGATDYAINIFHHALQGKKFVCPLKPDEPLPMIYMPDAVQAAIQLMETPLEHIRERGSYNLAGFSFTPRCIAAELQKRFVNFEITYQPGSEQEIAASWPNSVNDSQAQRDWNWRSNFNLPMMVENMLVNLA